MSATPCAQPKLECICGTLGAIGQRATFCYSSMARNWRRAGDHQSSAASVSAAFSSVNSGSPDEFHPFIPAVCPMRTLQKAGFWCLLHERRNGLIENGSAGHRRSRHLRYCSERALSSGSPLSRLTCLCEDRTHSRRISKRQTIRIKPMVGQETTSGGRFDQVMNGEGALEPISILNTRAVLPPELLILAQSPFLCGVFGKSLYFSDLWSRPPGSNRGPAYYETIPGS
jgi:hypothetical protein